MLNGKFIDTNVAFDILYHGRKRHDKALIFYEGFKNLELRLSWKVMTEINEILAESFAMLVGWIKASFRHFDRSSRDWDKMDAKERRKFLFDVETRMSQDKTLRSSNRREFILDGFHKIESVIVNRTLDEIMEALLDVPGDMTDEINLKLDVLFKQIQYDENGFSQPQLDLQEKVDHKVVSQYFNSKDNGKDKDIVVELFAILGMGIGKEKFQDLVFYTEDTGFIDNYGRLKGFNGDGSEPEDKELISFLQRTIPVLDIRLAYPK